MKTGMLVTVGLLALSSSLMAQQAAPQGMAPMKPMSDAAKLKLAMSAAPADVTKAATVTELDDKGTARQLRAGTNGWTCFVMPSGTSSGMDAMCGDKAWAEWGAAWMSKKVPTADTVGIAYMLQGDHGASNVDPYAMAPTATNQWLSSPPHLMLLVPGMKGYDELPTDPHAGGPWVMWKGTPYAHVMVPLSSMAMKSSMMPMEKKMPPADKN